MTLETTHMQIIQSIYSMIDWDFIVRMATLFIALLNMIVVFYIFRSTRSFAIKSILFEKKAVWYRSLGIEPNLESINCFYKKTTQILEEGQKEICASIAANNNHQAIIELVQRIVANFNSEIVELRKGFVDVITALNPTFGDRISRLFDDLQDIVNPKMGELLSKPNACCTDYVDVLRKHRVRLFKELYDYEILELLPPK
jgi:hypothetical protein